ncbi:MAG: hypothetical protein K2N03_01630 [Muribaculaceae bacterium]|nr:hypothetical protein [Muribaculaceae bacterium]
MKGLFYCDVESDTSIGFNTPVGTNLSVFICFGLKGDNFKTGGITVKFDVIGITHLPPGIKFADYMFNQHFLTLVANFVL